MLIFFLFVKLLKYPDGLMKGDQNFKTFFLLIWKLVQKMLNRGKLKITEAEFKYSDFYCPSYYCFDQPLKCMQCKNRKFSQTGKMGFNFFPRYMLFVYFVRIISFFP